MTARRSIVLGEREWFAFDAFADGTSSDALGANVSGHGSARGLFDVDGLQVDEVVPLRDPSRLATVTTEVLGLAAFHLRITSTGHPATGIALLNHDDATFLKRSQRLPQRRGSILVSSLIARPGNCSAAQPQCIPRAGEDDTFGNAHTNPMRERGRTLG